MSIGSPNSSGAGVFNLSDCCNELGEGWWRGGGIPGSALTLASGEGLAEVDAEGGGGCGADNASAGIASANIAADIGSSVGANVAAGASGDVLSHPWNLYSC